MKYIFHKYIFYLIIKVYQFKFIYQIININKYNIQDFYALIFSFYYFQITEDSQDQFQVISQQLYELQDQNQQLLQENANLKTKISSLLQFPPSNVSLESINDEQNQIQTDCEVESRKIDLQVQLIQKLQQQLSDLKKEQLVERDRNLRQLQLIKAATTAIQLQHVAQLPLNCDTSLQQETQINTLKTQIESLNAQLQSAKQIISQYQQQKHEDKTQILVDEIAKLKNRNVELQKKNIENSATIENLQQQNESLLKENEQSRQHIQKLQESQITCQQLMTEVTQQLQEYNNSTINLSQKVTELQGRLDLSEQKLKHINTQIKINEDVKQFINELNETGEIMDQLDQPETMNQTVDQIVKECQDKIKDYEQKELNFSTEINSKAMEIQTLKAEMTKNDSNKQQMIEQLQTNLQQQKDYIEQQNQIFQEEKEQFISKYDELYQQTDKFVQQYEQFDVESKIQTIQSQLEEKIKQITGSLQSVIENAKQQSFTYFNANIAEKIYNLTLYINGQMQIEDQGRFTSDSQKELEKLQNSISQIVSLHKEKISENNVLNSKILTQQQLIDIDSYNKDFVEKLQTENMNLKQEIKMVKEKSILFDQQEEIIKTYVAQIQDQDRSLQKLQTLLNLLTEKFKQAQNDTIEDLARVHCDLQYKDVPTRNDGVETDHINVAYKEVQTDEEQPQEQPQHISLDEQQIQALLVQNEINKSMSTYYNKSQSKRLNTRKDSKIMSAANNTFDVDRDVQEVRTFELINRLSEVEKPKKQQSVTFDLNQNNQSQSSDEDDYIKLQPCPKIENVASVFSQQINTKIQNQSQQVQISKLQSQAKPIKLIKHRSLLDNLN